MKEKENIFEYLGRKWKENKERRKKQDDKYWKLSAIERIDYDNKRERIKKENDSGFFTLTRLFLRVALYLVLGGLLFYYISGKDLLILLKIGYSFARVIIDLLGLIMITDVLIMYSISSRRNRILKELNKRFKLTSQ